MSPSSRRRVVAVLVVVAATAGAAVWALSGRTHTVPKPQEEFPVPSFRESAFLNTGPDAKYIGSGACAGCHRENHQSYLHTMHSRALSAINPGIEPPDAEFEHVLSGRHYRVYRENGQLHHEETIRRDGQTIARVDFPMKYLIGSGHFARTYGYELEGFLFESPVTWYSVKGKWGMSPGYDEVYHGSFERPLQETCVYCHAGRVEARDGAAHRLELSELAIGCESCHGPGSVHAARHRTKQVRLGTDHTIVNPGKLPRQLQEDVCAACHLTGIQPVPLRGRSINDFRPGTPLSDYRIHYRVEDGRNEMAVVGHVEQMRQSKCYQNSAMTCVTCHDPHRGNKPKDPVAASRAVCMTCHEKQPCTLDLAARVKKDGTDNCTGCHMPRGDTDIPHVAFTHHRIGHHDKNLEPGGIRSPIVVPLENVDHLPPADRRRNLALAYLDASGKPGYAEHYGREFHHIGMRMLQELYDTGMRDPESMRRLMLDTDPMRERELALEILQIPGAPATTRSTAALLLAKQDIQDGDYAAAAERLRIHNAILATSDSRRMLADCLLKLGRAEEALPLFKLSLALRHERSATHEGIIEAYRLLNRPKDAEPHLRQLEALRRLGPK